MIITSVLLLSLGFVQEPTQVCFTSDVKALCCPSACAVKSSPKWPDADKVLQSCMKSIGCTDSESKGRSVTMVCNCK